ncbi:MAG: ATP-dependent Clp protease adapter ClpS [Bowdeniella nasicola]|nr:ATP-dependent Clp protease adapter ClpS [Bowdeniella nasicola]
MTHMVVTVRSPQAAPARSSEGRLEECPDKPWQTIVWDDPVNLTSYVTYVFQRHFGYPFEQAEKLMLEVHFEGRAVVATGDKAVQTSHCTALQVYGLWATIAQEPS